jgi:hypothetical protein
MKGIDERSAVETDDVLTCQADYDTVSPGSTMRKFTKLPTSAQIKEINIYAGEPRRVPSAPSEIPDMNPSQKQFIGCMFDIVLVGRKRRF